jgi:hypothetical protein
MPAGSETVDTGSGGSGVTAPAGLVLVSGGGDSAGPGSGGW